MANLKLIKVTGSPFCSTFYGCIGIRATDNQFQIIKDGRLHGQSSHIGTGWKYATAEEIEESWDAIYPHWKPEVGDNVIVTQDYGDWAGCRAAILEKDDTGTDYYRVQREDGSMSTFDYTSQMILAPYSETTIETTIEPEEKSTTKFKVGDRVKCIGTTIKGYGKVGTVRRTGDSVGVEFDEDIDGHTLAGCCEDGHGWWIGSSGLELVTESKPKSERPPRRFKVGDKVTYKSRGDSYHYWGDDQEGFVGIVEHDGEYQEDKGCYNLRVTTKDGDFCYNMLECEFYEYDGLTIHSTLQDVSDGTVGITPSFSGYIDPLYSYKQKPITIKQKPKTKLTTI